MREASLLLTVLADASQHGYGIAPEVRENPGSLARASDADREHVIEMRGWPRSPPTSPPGWPEPGGGRGQAVRGAGGSQPIVQRYILPV